MRFDGKTTKRKWTDLNISKFSAVARPAQAPALMAIIKSASVPGQGQVTILPQEQSMTPEQLAKTIAATMKAANMNVNEAVLVKSISEAMKAEEGGDDPAEKKDPKKEDMPDLMKAFAGLPDADRLFAASLTGDDFAGYVMMDTEKRAALRKSIEQEIEAKKAAEEVLTLADGTEIHKSKDPLAFKIAKGFQDRLLKAEQQATKAVNDLEMTKLAKTAEEKFNALPGDPAQKAKLLKARESMDEDTKKVFDSMLEAGQTALADSPLYKESGYTNLHKGATPGKESNLMKAIKAEKAAKSGK